MDNDLFVLEGLFVTPTNLCLDFGSFLLFFLCGISLFHSSDDVMRRVEHTIGRLVAHKAILVAGMMLHEGQQKIGN